MIPSKEHTYRPDFWLTNTLAVETKGLFQRDDRHKMELVKAQHPELDIRMVFSNANAKIAKGSPTSYAVWCETHGIQWANKVIPVEWLDEAKTERLMKPGKAEARIVPC